MIKEEKFTMDEESMIKLLSEADLVRKSKSIDLLIDGKKWRIRTTSQSQNSIMLGYDYDILHWQNELKDCKDAKRAKRLNKRIRKTYAKKAAHKVLGMRLRWLPFAFCYMWRKIYHCSEKVSATINATEMISENKVFYLANLGSSKQALVLSMSQVGEAVEQRIKRGESAENMVEQDGLEKKADSK